jgi:adenylate kinase
MAWGKPPSMRIILLGAPGSGKGTQGHVLAEHFGVTHISTGELLRSEIARGSATGRSVIRYVHAGVLVPDDIVLELLLKRIAGAVAAGGYILDGFPRTLAQARRASDLAASASVEADTVVYLVVPDDIARERLTARAVEGRMDDADPEVTERRLQVFHFETEPLLDYYKKRGLLVTVDASGPPEEVSRSMISAIGAAPARVDLGGDAGQRPPEDRGG